MPDDPPRGTRAPFSAWLDESLAASPSAPYWQICLPLQLWMLYLTCRYSADTRYTSIWEMLLTPVHEGGHMLFAPLGSFMGILGGSLAQWLAPLLLALGFWRQRDLYALSFSLSLFGIALNQSYCYMDSSFKMEKYPDMVFYSLGSGEVTHDWQYIFGSLGMYRSYEAVALCTRALGLGILWLSLAAGGWLLWKQARRG
jgi:hypothetical protein